MKQINLDFTAFHEFTQQGNVIPLYREIAADLETPVSAFYQLQSDYSFLLESVEGGESLARYSFLSTHPFLLFKSTGTDCEITFTERQSSSSSLLTSWLPSHFKSRGKGIWKGKENPFQLLRRLMQAFQPVQVAGLPRFYGGAVGYMGYNTVRLVEKLPNGKGTKTNIPDIEQMLVRDLVVFDHVMHKILIVSNVLLPKDHATTWKQSQYQKVYREALERITALEKKLKQGKRPPLLPAPPWETTFSVDALASPKEEARFRDMVLRAKEYIRAGDIFQVVLSQQFTKTFQKTTPLQIYRILRMLNPSPYLFFMKYGKLALIGSSPEIMVRLEEGKVSLRPIAGTRPRGASEAEDQQLAEELRHDEKERAEHLMLVDLGRNDLGRVCELGSVQVKEWMTVERYSHVMHLVTQLVGKLKPHVDALDLIQATFPAGTVSGAPKIRAMEIIQELEAKPRGVYAGLVGYLSFSGDFDSCIAIRTIVTQGKKAMVQTGAGIVADSDPTREYWESINKAAGMLKAIHLATELS